MHTLPTTDNELAAWLRLSMAPGLRPGALRAMLNAFGLPQAILGQPFALLAAATDEASAHAALAPPGADFARYLDTVLAWRELDGNAIVMLDDPVYPPALLTMPAPPSLLYITGRLDLLHAKGVAVVGSRSATPQGVEDAERFSRALSEAGLAVVSGLALGIDGAAHRGALTGRGGTIAVIGTGADLVYPSAHQPLARQIAAAGTILSEWPLGTPARAANFPQRNRLIAGLVGGVLVVEAAMRSGSLITARLANEMGRDVFALPGSIHAPLSRGCHRMLKQGAKLVETPEKILKELGFVPPPAPPALCRGAAYRMNLLRLDPHPAPRQGPRPRPPQPIGLLAKPTSGQRPTSCSPLSAIPPRRLKSLPPAPTCREPRCKARCCSSNWPAV